MNSKILPQEFPAQLKQILNHALQLTTFEAAHCFVLSPATNQILVAVQQTTLNHSTLITTLEKVTPQQFPAEIDVIDPLAESEAHKPLVEAGLQAAVYLPVAKIEQPAEQIGALFFYQQTALTELDSLNPLLDMIAAHIGLVIERHQLHQMAQTVSLQAEALHIVNKALNSDADISALLRVLLEQIIEVVPADVATVSLIENGRATTTERIDTVNQPAAGKPANSFTITQMPNIKKMIAHKRPHLIPNTETAADWVWVPGYHYIRSWIGLPIFANDRLEAIIDLHKTEPDFYSTDHLTLLEAFQNQAGLIIHNARLFAQAKKQASALTILNHLARDLTAATTVQEIGQQVTDCLHENFYYSRATLYLYIATPNEQRLELVALSGRALEPPLQQESLADEEGVIGQAAETGEVQQQTYHLAETDVTPPTKMRQIAIPIKVDTPLTAVLAVESLLAHETNREIVELILGTISDQLSTALQKVRLFEETTRYLTEMSTLHEVSSLLRTTNTTGEILSLVIHKCVQLCSAAGGSIMLIDHEGASDDLILSACYPEDSRTIGLRYKKEDGGIVHHVAQTKEVYIATDVPNDPLTHIPAGDRPAITTARSSISIPLESEERLIGVLSVWFKQHHIFTSDETHLLTAIAEMAGGAIERATIYATLEQRVQERTQKLEEANKQLQELDALKSRFISEVSHELRTPITNLSLYVNLFKRNKDRPEKQEKYLAVLNKQVERLENLIENVLYLSRLDLGQDRFEFVPVDLNELIEEVLIAQIDHAETKGLVLTYEAKRYAVPTSSWMGVSRPVKVLGDRNQLAQLITHLVDNAIKYTEEGSVQVHMYLDTKETVCIEVKDNGIGIPAHEWDNIFKRFYRGERNSQLNIPGNGLGLAIAEEVVKLHNGRIDLESKVDEGSKFLVWLPIIPF